MRVGVRGFLSCLHGSELNGDGTGQNLLFLSCLHGSEQKLN